MRAGADQRPKIGSCHRGGALPPAAALEQPLPGEAHAHRRRSESFSPPVNLTDMQSETPLFQSPAMAGSTRFHPGQGGLTATIDELIRLVDVVLHTAHSGLDDRGCVS